MPDSWHAGYNLACFEALAGNRESALESLERAAELAPARVPKAAAEDEDFDSVRDDPRFLAVTRQADAAGSGS